MIEVMAGIQEALGILTVGVVLLSTTTLGRWYSITYEKDTNNDIPDASMSENCAYLNQRYDKIHIGLCLSDEERTILCQDLSAESPSECMYGDWLCNSCVFTVSTDHKMYPTNDCYTYGWAPNTCDQTTLSSMKRRLWIGFYGIPETAQQSSRSWYYPVFKENHDIPVQPFFMSSCISLDISSLEFSQKDCNDGEADAGLCTPINNNSDPQTCPGFVIEGTCYWLSILSRYIDALEGCMKKGGVLARVTKGVQEYFKGHNVHNVRYLWLGFIGYRSVGNPSNNNNQAPGAGESGDNQVPGPGESGDGLSSGEGSTVLIMDSTSYTKQNGDVAITTGLVYIGGQGTTKGQRNTEGQGLISDVSTTGSPDNIHDVITTGSRDNAMNTTEHSNCCFCFLVPELSAAIVRDKVERIKKELTVPRKNLSASIRKRTSAPDDRSSSVQIGTTAIIIVSVIFSAIVLPDVVTLVVAIKVSILK